MKKLNNRKKIKLVNLKLILLIMSLSQSKTFLLSIRINAQYFETILIHIYRSFSILIMSNSNAPLEIGVLFSIIILILYIIGAHFIEIYKVQNTLMIFIIDRLHS